MERQIYTLKKNITQVQVNYVRTLCIIHGILKINYMRITLTLFALSSLCTLGSSSGGSIGVTVEVVVVIVVAVLIQCSLLYKTTPAAKPKRSYTPGGLI